jgi:predicted  nucleic acid-binding Zn-ribbon protein
MSQPFKLYRLQQIDSQLDRGHVRMNEIQNALNDKTRLKKAQSQMEKIEKSLKEVSQSLHKIEGEVQAQRLKIEQNEATLYGGKVRNPKELQDLHQESSALKRYLAVLEDRQLEEMLILDEAQESQNKANEYLEKIRIEMAEINANLVKEQVALQKVLDQQAVQRQVAVKGISPEDLQLYESLRAQRNGVAVARVTDNACSACGSTLSASLLQSSRSPNQISRCDTCGRILYAG